MKCVRMHIKTYCILIFQSKIYCIRVVSEINNNNVNVEAD